MTTLYYVNSNKKLGIKRGDYACECRSAVAEMAMQRSPGKFCLFEQTFIGNDGWFNIANDYTKTHYADDIDGISLAVGGTD